MDAKVTNTQVGRSFTAQKRGYFSLYELIYGNIGLSNNSRRAADTYFDKQRMSYTGTSNATISFRRAADTYLDR